jgi:exosortase
MQTHNTANVNYGALDAASGNMLKKHAAFAMFFVISLLVFQKTIHGLVLYALSNEASSHIITIPFLSFFLLYTERKKIFSEAHPSIASGLAFVLAGVFLYVAASTHLFSMETTPLLSETTFCIVVIWMGGFLACYGSRATRVAAFPLLFLLLMIPLPEGILERTTTMLQEGSTGITYLIFKTLGVPVLRQGFELTVGQITIEIAKECSGIRSSIALFITCLMAAHFFLRTHWKMFLFVLISLPFAIIKNGIRIATLTLLSAYVNPSFLTGSLHRDGGFVFFLLSLAMVGFVLFLFYRSEGQSAPENPMSPNELKGLLASE